MTMSGALLMSLMSITTMSTLCNLANTRFSCKGALFVKKCHQELVSSDQIVIHLSQNEKFKICLSKIKRNGLFPEFIFYPAERLQQKKRKN
jgi:hypothetical protein